RNVHLMFAQNGFLQVYADVDAGTGREIVAKCHSEQEWHAYFAVCTLATDGGLRPVPLSGVYGGQWTEEGFRAEFRSSYPPKPGMTYRAFFDAMGQLTAEERVVPSATQFTETYQVSRHT